VSVEVETLTQHAAGEVGGDHARTPPRGIPAALGGAGTDLEQLLAAKVTQQAGICLTKTLGPPHEVVVAEEGPVLRVVAVRLAVPPCTVGPRCLVRIGSAPVRPVILVGSAIQGSLVGPATALVSFVHAHILPDLARPPALT